MPALCAAITSIPFSNADNLVERLVLLAIYIVAAALCGSTAIAIKRSLKRRVTAAPRPGAGYRRRRRFWIAAAVCLLTAGLSIELGLIDRIVAQFRTLFYDHGWYQNRWLVQGTILGGAAVSLIALVLFVWRRRNEWYPRDRWAVASLFALLFTLAARALSQHHTEELFSIDMLHVSLGRWLELSMLGGLCICALWTMRCRAAVTRPSAPAGRIPTRDR